MHNIFKLPYRIPISYSQSEAVSTGLISCDIKPMTWYGYDIMRTWLNLRTVNT